MPGAAGGSRNAGDRGKGRIVAVSAVGGDTGASPLRLRHVERIDAGEIESTHVYLHYHLIYNIKH